MAGVVGGALLLAALLPPGVVAATPPTFTSAAGATFTVGVAGSFTVTASGALPITFAITAGALPNPLTLKNNLNGTASIAGTPNIADAPGAYVVTISATNGGGTTNQVFTLTLMAAGPPGAPTFTSAASTTFTRGVAGNFTVSVSGTAPITLTITSGALPNPVSFTDHGNGTASIAGTPNIADTLGAYVVTISATNGGGTTNQVFTLTLVASAADHLVFYVQPGGGAAGAAWTQQPVVEAYTSSNVVDTTDSTSYVYLSIVTNPASGLLTCTNTSTTVRLTNGVASFSGCSINVASASYYQLQATSSAGYTAVTSAAFYISGSQLPVTITDAIATGVNRGTSGFGTKSVVVPPNGYVTVLGLTNPSLAGSVVQIWVKSKTVGWHRLTSRIVASDGTVHYYARVNGWTAYWIKFAGNSTYAAASSHGRIATNPT